MTTVHDTMGNISRQYADAQGNIVKTSRCTPDGAELTAATYEYNGIGEMTAAYDKQGNPVKAGYDMLGRRTSLSSTDTGLNNPSVSI